MPENKNFYTFDELAKRLHKEGATLVDFDGKKIPCIYIDVKRYDEIMTAIYGKKVAVDTLLDIFHDGQDVFVDVRFNFLDVGIKENYLFHANNMLEFFQALSDTGLISLAPSLSGGNSSHIFMVQLPKRESAENAYEIIKSNIKNNNKMIDNNEH
ncbi:MAG TPA: hypothetical protein VJ729_07475 [Nitrososphaeraceae archaeon]|jgi:hypothetical protein|nr:hypothetical protein [Nitrososphaeraceae archaeon]